MPAERSYTRLLSPLLTIALVAGFSGTAGAASSHGASADARTLVAEVRQAMAAGGIADVLATAGIDGASATSTGDPVSALSEAVARAGALIDAAVPSDPSHVEARARTLRALRMHERVPDLLDAAGHEAVNAASSIVAAAIDAALPDLLAMRTPAASGERTVGCDVADQAPALCIAGTGANLITQDYALVVDLGGDDIHANSAGGADTLENGLPVSVTIDVGGNDAYSTKSPTSSGSQVAQGAAIAGAGFLIDVAGDDSYSIATDAPFAVAMGQGKALSGVGVLADLGGNDSFELDARGPGFPLAIGQGDGAHGAGILLDLAGNDRHVIRATATEFFLLPLGGVAPPFSVATGLGTGAFGYVNFQTPPPVHADGSYRNMGFGLFADAGGTDTLDIVAETPDPPDDNFFGPSLIGLPGAVAFGAGAAREGGVGLAVLGPGATDASVTTTTRAQYAAARSAGLGHGEGGGQGIMSDAGGDDLRTLGSDVSVARNNTATDGCGGCETEAWARTDAATIQGMGSGYGGFGLLEDLSGADKYLASAANVVDTKFHDERSNGDAGRSKSIAGPVRVAVQGAGDSSGFGELVDAAGDDTYEVVAGSLAKSKASHGTNSPKPTVEATAGDSVVLAQASARGLGTGSLTDLGGSDTYIVTSSTGAETDPESSGEAGAASAGALASVDEVSAARFTDRDDDQPDSFSISPATPACTGTRGQGTWVDCGGAGVGLVA